MAEQLTLELSTKRRRVVLEEPQETCNGYALSAWVNDAPPPEQGWWEVTIGPDGNGGLISGRMFYIKDYMDLPSDGWLITILGVHRCMPYGGETWRGLAAPWVEPVKPRRVLLIAD